MADSTATKKVSITKEELASLVSDATAKAVAEATAQLKAEFAAQAAAATPVVPAATPKKRGRPAGTRPSSVIGNAKAQEVQKILKGKGIVDGLHRAAYKIVYNAFLKAEGKVKRFEDVGDSFTDLPAEILAVAEVAKVLGIVKAA